MVGDKNIHELTSLSIESAQKFYRKLKELYAILKLCYQDAAPVAMIGASNHFEVAIATSIMLFGLSSGAALATVVGVLIEVPVMLMLVEFCKKTSENF